MTSHKDRVTDPGNPKPAKTIEQVRRDQAENERRLAVAQKPKPEKK